MTLFRSFSIIFIALTTLLFACGNESAEQVTEQSENEWITLWDGETFNNWRVSENPDSFTIEDGKIVVDGPRAHLFYDGPVENADFTDFEFQAEVYTYPEANSGVFFHTQFQEQGWPAQGYEAQVNATHSDRIKTGSLYGVENVMDQAPHEDNEWFTYHLRVEGNQITFSVDGEVVMEFTEPADREGTVKLSSGTFALQAHDPNSRIYFRDIKVRPIH